MSSVTEGAAPPPPLALPGASALRDVLEANGFTANGVREALAIEGQVLGDGVDALSHEYRLGQAPPAQAALIRLLVLGNSVDATLVDGALVDSLERHGLVQDEAGTLRARVRVVPHDHLLIASDILVATHPNHVAAVHRPSAVLGNLTVRRHVRRAADIGTGNGIQALLCAAHAEHVVATDVNERALSFAEFNAALNGIDNIEFRAGSFLEPVAGERFDLVVSNPPYVISPETALIFRDSGLPGDTVSAQLVAALPQHLSNDGFASVMISWVADHDELVRPRAWVEGSGCDAWLLHTHADSALDAAINWNRPAGDPDVVRERVERWLAYYDQLGIERIAYGALVLHRRDGDNWFRAGNLPPHTVQPASDQLQRMFAARLDDMLDRPLTLVPSVLVQRAARIEDGRWAFVDATAELREGPGFGINLDAVGVALIECFDGSGPLRSRLPGLAAQLDVPRGRLVEFAEAFARHLVSHGFAV